MALDPELVQKLRILARCKPEMVAQQLTQLATTDPEQWRLAINTFILTMWIKISSAAAAAAEAKAGVTAFNKMLEVLGAQAGAQEPAIPPGMPGRPAAPQVAGPLPLQPGGVRIGGDGTPITDPAQLAAEAMMDQAMGIAPPQGAPPGMPGRPVVPGPQGGPLPPRPAGGRLDHSVGADGQPNTPEQQRAEQILDEAMGLT